MDKLDLTIELLQRLDSKLDRLAERISDCERDQAAANVQMQAMQQTLEAHRADDQKLAAKVEDLNKWRWTTVGALTILTIAINLFSKRLY